LWHKIVNGVPCIARPEQKSALEEENLRDEEESFAEFRFALLLRLPRPRVETL